MPKIIEALRDKLLAEARKQLLAGGEMSIRALAQGCHIAVGTVYNYFSSKDEVMAHVMLQDWRSLLERAGMQCADAPDPINALRHVFDALTEFTGLYRHCWIAYASGNHEKLLITERHTLLVEQLVQLITPMLQRFDALWTPCLPTFLAETLLTSVSHGPEDFDAIRPVLVRLTEKTGEHSTAKQVKEI